MGIKYLNAVMWLFEIETIYTFTPIQDLVSEGQIGTFLHKRFKPVSFV